MLLDVISWILLSGGVLLAITGGIGMLRLPEFYTRMHAASVTDTGGAILIIAGLLCQAPNWPVGVRLLLVLVFLLFTSPTATHALAKAARRAGLEPNGGNEMEHKK